MNATTERSGTLKLMSNRACLRPHQKLTPRMANFSLAAPTGGVSGFHGGFRQHSGGKRKTARLQYE